MAHTTKERPLSVREFISAVEAIGGYIELSNGSVFIGSPVDDGGECFWTRYDALKARLVPVESLSSAIRQEMRR